MKISLKHKIFLLLLLALSGLFLISSYIYYKNLNNFAQYYAYESSKHDLELINNKIDRIKLQGEFYISQFLNNQPLISSINLISNYQDKNNYDKKIFDDEKKKILTYISNLLGSNSAWSISIFDKDKDLITFKRYKKHQHILAYTSIENKKIKLYNLNDKEFKQFKPKKLDLNNLEKFNIVDRKDELILKRVIKITHDDEILGYLRVSYIINDSNFKSFIKGIENNVIVISNNISLNSLENKSVNIDFNTIDKNEKNILKDYEQYFFNLDDFYDTKNISIISYIDKSIYNKYLNDTLVDLGITLLLIILAFLFITSIFTAKIITQPLDKLLKGINKLKNKEASKIDINSGDEIETIAKEFNQISFQLKNSFKSLEEANVLLENVLNTVPMSIFMKDVKGTYKLVNKLFLKNAGLKEESDIVGKCDFDIWDKEDAQAYVDKDNKIIESMKAQLNFEERQIRDGKEFTIITSKMPLANSKGEIIGILGIYRDITDEKIREKKLKEKEKQLMHQSRLAQMGEMISMIAHQWRQPLSAVSSTTNTLMLKTVTNKFEKEFFYERLQNISNYSQHLSSTIDDFRNFFKRNKEQREILLSSIADDSLRITQTAMENKDIKIIKDYKDESTVTTYANELRQVVLNLIKNSEDILIEKDIKEKWIKIRTYKENEHHILEVSDNGGGIPENIIHKIFEPYYSTKTNKDGTGLGLYMSKAIVEDHCKGRITVQNGQHGAIFKVIL